MEVIGLRLLLIFLLTLSLVACQNNAKEEPEPPIDETIHIEESMPDMKEKELTEKEIVKPKKEASFTVDQSTWTLKKKSSEDQGKYVLLTIDDAPDQYALEMANVLHELNVPAIFFVNGHFLDEEEEKEVLRKIVDLGFVVGNHTVGHENLRKLPENQQVNQIVTLNDTIVELTGEKPKFFRAPFGVNTETSINTAQSEGMITMNWTYGYDWEKEYMTKERIAEIMVNTPLLRDGAILLMHDRKWSYEALTDIVNGLREKGYEFADPRQITNE
nr:polysaccharide deacetylase family protein [Bacillus kexueae]